MSASAEPDGNRLALAGQITADNVLAIRQRGEAWLASLTPGVPASVDLSAVTTASSVLLSLLLCLRRFADQRQVTLTFAGTPDDLVGLSHLNGISRWLTGPS
ncbi:STAS domain-containing protein [Marinobacter lacisalsi]|uniref:STAS domain-containing protein n=1 Tax=Marinobacter lacisalsi TaxID=475979 RepID=A0ABV8QJL4_9GAMM